MRYDFWSATERARRRRNPPEVISDMEDFMAELLRRDLIRPAPEFAKAGQNDHPWPQGPTIELAHALVHRVLTSAEIRGLFIKGPVAVAQGLRETTRVSTDVDVLCGPRRAREAIRGLRFSA